MGAHLWLVAEHGLVVLQQASHHVIPRIMMLYMVTGLHTELAYTCLERLAHGRRHRPTIVGRAQAATLFVDDFREAPARTATTGVALAIASRMTRPNVSWSPACTSKSALAISRATSADGQK